MFLTAFTAGQRGGYLYNVLRLLILRALTTKLSQPPHDNGSDVIITKTIQNWGEIR